MKKLTQKLIVATIMATCTLNLFADQILAKYEFTGGSKLSSILVPGVTFGSEFAIHNSTPNPAAIAFNNDLGYMIVKNVGKGVSAKSYGYFSITPDAGKTIEITKVEVTHKKGTPNAFKTRCYLYDAIKDTPVVLANLISAGGTGGWTLPTDWTSESFVPTGGKVSFNKQSFMSLTVTQAIENLTQMDEWWIDELSFYGNVISVGDIVCNETLDFGNAILNGFADNSFTVSVFGGTATPVYMSLEGKNANMFKLYATEISAIDATAGANINVEYSPTASGMHTATIRLSYGVGANYKEKLITLTGTCPLLNEDFGTYISDPDIMKLMDKTQVTNLNDFTATTGWLIADSVFWHYTTSWNLGLEIRSYNNKLAYVTTPELDLSKPFGLKFKSKKMGKQTNLNVLGQMYVLVDNDTIYSIVNPSDGFTDRLAEGFVGKSNSRITFCGIPKDSSKVAIDNISAYYTFNPSLNLPLSSAKQLPSAKPGLISNITIPIVGYNLTADLSFTVPTGSSFQILNPIIPIAEAEAGTTLKVQFNAPAQEKMVYDRLLVGGGGLYNQRQIFLSAESNVNATAIQEHKINTLVKVIDNKVKIFTDIPSRIIVTTLSGAIYKEIYSTSNSTIDLPTGVYIVKVNNIEEVSKVKVLIK